MRLNAIIARVGMTRFMKQNISPKSKVQGPKSKTSDSSDLGLWTLDCNSCASETN
jgi:hypothetical protein